MLTRTLSAPRPPARPPAPTRTPPPGHDYAFFGSSGPLRGFKRCLTEGGIRTPLIVSYPDVVAPGSTSLFPTAFWDLGDTMLELAGVPRERWLAQDGRSVADVLRSPSGQPAPGAPPRQPLYFEFCTDVHPPKEPRSGKGWGRAVINGTMKLVSFFRDQPSRLYDLAADEAEVHNLADAHPDVVAALEAYAEAAHTDSPIFPIQNCLAS